jgi:glycosyltransferase involved in cell wall biosynthesis
MRQSIKILYLSSLCSLKEYERMFNQYGKTSSHASQKYNRMMVDGLKYNGANIDALSQREYPVKNRQPFYIRTAIDEEEGIKYTYLPCLNIKIIRRLFLILSAFIEIVKWCVKNKSGVIVCDIILGELAIAANMATLIVKRKKIAIVTDVPIYRAGKPENILRKFTANIKNKQIFLFDGYIFLTKFMNDLLNPLRKPYMIIEGFVDVKMANVENKIEDKYNTRVCMMAGLLDKVFGVEMLVKAFIKANMPNTELHLYGNGDYVDELKLICKEHDYIKYFGEVLNLYIVNEELKSTLMINPRPSTEEYTKYSFPSKNMEYMVSGTPILTTKLPGIPKEYYDYIFLLEDESVDGLAELLKKIMSMNNLELHGFGIKAKEWVLNEKNNIISTKKIIDMLILIK